MLIQDIRDALVIREGDIFLFTDISGNVPPANPSGFGLYHLDTRYLSVYDFSFAAARPVVLLSTAELGFSEEQVLTNPAMTSLEGRILPRGSIEVRRQRVVDHVLEETLCVTNYNIFPIEIDVVYTLDADFADIFEVRGHERKQRGQLLPPRIEDSAMVFAYQGLDGRKRQTVVAFSPRPFSTSESRVAFRLSLGHRESATIRLLVATDGRATAPLGTERIVTIASHYRQWLESGTQVVTNNEFFNAVLERSLADLRMLWNQNEDGTYLAAGTPWYDAFFGRDSAIVAMQTLAYKPDIARHCLKMLARWQGKNSDPWRDEEPGKILHEWRQDEMTATGILPFSPYYGSVDSTPLFLMLAGEYYAWTADLELLRELEPNIRAALDWINGPADMDGDGYVEYEARSVAGLVNQGWKDSSDAIVNADGTLAKPPIALVEVQGYVYAAKKKLAPVFAALGDQQLAQQLTREAVRLEQRFNRDFWSKESKFLALALDGDNQQVTTITSNPGQALWTGIVRQPLAAAVVDVLMRNDMFSGWGIRTLSATSSRFNPLGYHLGTVWPHDNSIIAMGFKKYGFEDELNEVATALFDAARAFPYYRLPELFAGCARSTHYTPVPYPVACRPQAWAAGSFPLFLQAILGLAPNAPKGELLVVRPHLPYWLDSVEVRNLQVGPGSADLLFSRRGTRTRVDVLATRGGLKVSVARRWPATS
ncbi:MAG: amylo-alpha-1,6-glucosidase [Dehalococcoidia bacterium]